MGNDFYDDKVQFTRGDNCFINNAILDKNVKIGNRVKINVSIHRVYSFCKNNCLIII